MLFNRLGELAPVSLYHLFSSLVLLLGMWDASVSSYLILFLCFFHLSLRKFTSNLMVLLEEVCGVCLASKTKVSGWILFNKLAVLLGMWDAIVILLLCLFLELMELLGNLIIYLWLSYASRNNASVYMAEFYLIDLGSWLLLGSLN